MYAKNMAFELNYFSGKKSIKEKLIYVLHHHPDRKEVAWSVAVGTFVALTPTFGIQIFIVVLLWNIMRFSRKLKFNLPIAASLTFITNYLTIIPYYFLSYKTGCWLFEKEQCNLTYDTLAYKLQSVMESGFFDSVISSLKIISGIYRPLLTGSTFYAVVFTFLVYILLRNIRIPNPFKKQ